MVFDARSRSALIIPTLNAGDMADRLIEALDRQQFKPAKLLVLDSQSTDGTADKFRRAGADVIEVERANFDHGGTRQQGADLCDEYEFLIFLTQDAIPADDDAIGRLVEAFADPTVGVAYGRQLPRPEAGALEAVARLFNYPPTDRIVTPSSARGMGIKASFCSNSFAAYRADALAQVGGFPRGTIFGEDAIVTGRLLLAGWTKAYVSRAAVVHSHDYLISEEARRYFDVGVLHSREHWLLEAFGRAEGEGLAFIRAQFGYLLKHDPLAILSASARVLVKYAAYRLGLIEARLPVGFKCRLSMSPRFWRRPERLLRESKMGR
ncbi:MAG TPA: glycosyltransferase [Aliidongia sp.]|uniref:glycosyltransferase family 2 protein n=1 Tax=Aliidongia sp. TaxID=1914230 RepID=UPI002DDD72A7|nr:glycosyltransferase [Aliidongia sp.]HEV2674569.1 glycosyltransferase [Aliidongia sp.]